MWKKIAHILPLVFLLFLSGCREEFEMEFESGDTAPILVVEGFIDAGRESSRYQLSFARSLGNTTPFLTYPSSAKVTIEGMNGQLYTGNREGAGTFIITHPVLDASQPYRLLIEADGESYESEFVPVNVSQEIDAVDWALVEEGVEVYVSTEDASGASRYYRYEYEETWRYHPPFVSSVLLEADGVTARPREATERIDICYQSDRSRSILLATSEHLEKDAIYRFPVALIPHLSEKLTFRYSILVRQIPVTEAAYTYWEQLRESSENLGDVFGPMPAELFGNIYCVSQPDRQVIGLVEAAQIAEKRLYINRSSIPEFWPVQDAYYVSCGLKNEDVTTALIEIRSNPSFMLVEAVSDADSGVTTGFTYATRQCVDCRIKGGTVDPPDFWVF